MVRVSNTRLSGKLLYLLMPDVSPRRRLNLHLRTAPVRCVDSCYHRTVFLLHIDQSSTDFRPRVDFSTHVFCLCSPPAEVPIEIAVLHLALMQEEHFAHRLPHLQSKRSLKFCFTFSRKSSRRLRRRFHLSSADAALPPPSRHSRPRVGIPRSAGGGRAAAAASTRLNVARGGCALWWEWPGAVAALLTLSFAFSSFFL